MDLRPLNPIEARVLGTLMEKARTVPDTYPLSLNLVLTGSNQKSSRDPVMQLSEAEAQEALDGLLALSLVTASHGGRVVRYAHNVQRRLQVPEQSAVLLGLLMLRGPQTAGELRLNAERWYRFADISSVEGFLQELAERSAEQGGPLVQLLPRAPGARESRWTQLLCGPVDVEALAAGQPAPALPGSERQRIEHLEAEVVALRRTVDRLCRELGLDGPDADAPELSPGGPKPGDFHAKNHPDDKEMI